MISHQQVRKPSTSGEITGGGWRVIRSYGPRRTRTSSGYSGVETAHHRRSRTGCAPPTTLPARLRLPPTCMRRATLRPSGSTADQPARTTRTRDQGPCLHRQSHPVEGGSANDYDYANADPINQFDLTGLGPCPPFLHRTREDGSHYCKGNAAASPVKEVYRHTVGGGGGRWGGLVPI